MFGLRPEAHIGTRREPFGPSRTPGRPRRQTCGGVQHALLEYARNVLGLKEAAHAEINPDTGFPLLQQMECSLVEKSQRIVLVSGTGFEKIYGADSGLEDFHCRYGPPGKELLRTARVNSTGRINPRGRWIGVW